jgi:hypothetical protein
MAFASAYARPTSFRFIRPGPASLWFPPRLFPASRWLAEQRPASAATPACSAAVSGGSSPHRDASPTRRQAGTEAGATSTALPRLDLELRLLFSRYTPAPDEDFFVALRIELGRRAWSLERAIGAPRPAWSAAPGDESGLEKRRARLVTDVNLGLTMVEAAPIRYPRPARNAWLARHAGHVGQRLRDLLSHPEAGSLAAELARLLDALRQCL